MTGRSGPTGLVGALESAVRAAADADADAFAEARAGLARWDPEQLSLVQAAAVRLLLEELAPDGLSGDDVRERLERTVRTALAWWPETDTDALIEVYTAALGMSDPDADGPRVGRQALVDHAHLVLADLVGERGRAAGTYLALGLGELERAQTIELP